MSIENCREHQYGLTSRVPRYRLAVELARQPLVAGACALAARGKSGLHRTGRQVTPGKRELTESAAESRPPRGRRLGANGFAVRVKGCGKSAPHGWQHRWLGKPRPEQGQIGIPRYGPYRIRVGRLRPPVTTALDEWLPAGTVRRQNPAYRPARSPPQHDGTDSEPLGSFNVNAWFGIEGGTPSVRDAMPVPSGFSDRGSGRGLTASIVCV